MKKVITYGTFDLLHHGHINLLKRARELGDYLIVGVTSDSYDFSRGKINVSQSVAQRVEAIRATGLADQVIIEEYEGQKIDDIMRFDVDVFTVGSDWEGHFDYLKTYCDVIYLDRTRGISSSELRAAHLLSLGLVGDLSLLEKVARESTFVNGIEVRALVTDQENLEGRLAQVDYRVSDFEEMLGYVDALYIVSDPLQHVVQIATALKQGKHVLCAAPIATTAKEFDELFALAQEHNCVLMDGIKTSFTTAYSRLLLLVKTGIIGSVVSVDATCTSLEHRNSAGWNSICSWGPTALLPVLDILGTDFREKKITTLMEDGRDAFTKIDLTYDHAVGSIKVGKGVKSEGELVVSGTQGYIYVPAPWWKTDYFEVRFENPALNKRHFYQLDGEGIRYMLVNFARLVQGTTRAQTVDHAVSRTTVDLIEAFDKGEDTTYLSPISSA